MEYIILFYDTSATGRAHSISKVDTDITRLSDVRSDFNKFWLCWRAGSIFDYRGCHAAFPILILMVIFALNLMPIF